MVVSVFVTVYIFNITPLKTFFQSFRTFLILAFHDIVDVGHSPFLDTDLAADKRI